MIVVTLTSWTKRINNVLEVVKSVMSNSLQPDRLYLNLSKTEFEGIELPKNLIDYFDSDDRLILNWVEGENTKTMKKVFPILKYLNDDDIIINTALAGAVFCLQNKESPLHKQRAFSSIELSLYYAACALQEDHSIELSFSGDCRALRQYHHRFPCTLIIFNFTRNTMNTILNFDHSYLARITSAYPLWPLSST